MADLPKDPRQLARDILAGKVSIEDLAREQARRRAGGAAPPRMEPPRQVPLPRAPGAQPLPPPVQRPGPLPSAQRMPARVPQRQAPQPVRRGPVVMTQRTVRRPLVEKEERARVPLTEQAVVVERPAETAVTERAVANQVGGVGLTALLRNTNTLRQGIVLAEVLGPPVGLRDRVERF